MRSKPLFILTLILLMLPFSRLAAQKQTGEKINWTVAGQLPAAEGFDKQLGLAGSSAGVHNNVLLIAGGCNFPDNFPWRGGTKTYYNDIYVARKNVNGELKWIEKTFKLPFNLAYAATVTTSKGVLCIGGENEAGIRKEVILLQWDNTKQSIIVKQLPALPVALSNASATLLNNIVYVTGGETSNETTSSFLSLDYSNPEPSWKKLPDLPLAASHTVTVNQSNAEYPCIYVFGGRAKSPSGISTLHQTAFMFDPQKNRWSELERISDKNIPVNALSAGTGIATGSTYILLIGGDKGDIFTQIEAFNAKIAQASTTEEKQTLQSAKEELLINHQGFSKSIYIYNTVTNAWTKGSDVPFLTPVTTTAVTWGDDIFIAGGEVKPGVRTPDILKGSMKKQQYFSWVDYSVLTIYLLLMVAIGLWTSRHQGSTDDYFRGGQKIPGWAAGLSIYGTQLSAITFMSIPAKTYATNWNYFFLQMTIIMIIPVITKYFIPFFRKLEITSAYEYLEKRFNYAARAMASLLFIMLQVGRLAIVLLLPSLALTLVTGIDVNLCILLMGIITIFYTMKGGIEAVIWTDVVQVVILLGGALLCLILIPFQINQNAAALWETLQENNKFEIINTAFNFTEPTLWVVLIGGFAINMITYGADQTVVQKYLTTKDEEASRKSLKLGAWMALPSAIIFFAIGTMLFLFFRTYPEKANFQLQSQDAIFPWYIVSELPAGVTGLVIAAVFAAAMSTLSSSLNSVATAIIIDFYKPLNPQKGEKSYLTLARLITLVVGVVATALAVYMATQGVSSLWDQFNTILGLFTGGLGGLFVLGIFSKKANGRGVILGLLTSGAFQYFITQHTKLNFLLYAFTGLISCIVFGYLFSLLTGEKNKDISGLTIYNKKNDAVKEKSMVLHPVAGDQ